MSTKPRKRRWIVFAAIAVALLAAGVATLVYTSDPTRVVAIAERALARELGLVLRHDGEPRIAYWPRFGVVLRDYRVDVAASGRTLASGDSLAIEVPWRALAGGPPTIERIALDAPVFDAAAIAGWKSPLSRSAAPMRWPAIDGGIVVRGGRIVNIGSPPRAIDAIDLELSAVEPGAPLTTRFGWTPRGDGTHARTPVRVAIEGVARNDADGIALEDATASLQLGDSPRLVFNGEMHAGRERTSLDGRIRTSAVPARIAAYVVAPGDPQPATDLELRLAHRSQRWHVRAHGSLAGVAVDADLGVAAWPDIEAPLPELIEWLRRDVTGTARIERLRVGGATLEDVTLGDDDATAPN